MQRQDETDDSQRSRPSSRRSSVSLPRKNSLMKEKDKKIPVTFHSAHSTPKRTARPSLDFMVSGKQILKRSDRANSLPGSCRPQSESPISLPRGRRIARVDESEASPEPSLEDDLSLDLSQVSDFEDGILRYGKQPFTTSTPKPDGHKSTPHEDKSTSQDGGCKSTPQDGGCKSTLQDGEHKTPQDFKSQPPRSQKPRSASLQHLQQRVERRASTQQSVDLSKKSHQSVDLTSGRSQQSDLQSARSQQSDFTSSKTSRDTTFSYSKDSLYKTPSSDTYRYGTDYSSVSPEYSQSSTELSPRAEPSPVLSSCCSHSCERTVEDEWSSFWANYNTCPLPLPRPLYDQCPTPYREHLDEADFEFAERARTRSPAEGLKHISNIIKSEGLRLSPRDAQRVIHCAHLLGSVLSRAVDARAQSTDKKRTLTLNLKTSVSPVTVKKSETVTTQTDISLPNTKSAPLIFESILRQLSKSSMDEPDEPEKEKDESQNEK